VSGEDEMIVERIGMRMEKVFHGKHGAEVWKVTSVTGRIRFFDNFKTALNWALEGK
jgi:hypothetical protein